jgi:hypothetical protein
MVAARITTEVRRVFSQTPLARGYDEALLGSRRVRRKVRFEAFDASRYPRAALDLAADAHLRLAEGEYHAVGLFGRIASGVAMVPAPFDLVAAATRVSSDEIRHADYCTRFASLCAGRDVTLTVDREALAAAAPVLPGVVEVDFLIAKYAATGETLAAALLAACRKRAKDPVARALFSSLLGDEVHHAHLGWYYLAWRAPLWSQAERQIIADGIGEFVAEIEQSLWFGRDAPPEARAAADALGVLDSESQREVVRAVMEDEIVPGLDAIGLGASHAWRARRRGPPGAPVAGARREDFVFGGDARGVAPPEPRGGAVAEARSDAVDGHAVAAPEAPDPTVTTSVVDRAADWLAAQVDGSGAVGFSLDAKSRAREATGPLHHGRAAIAVRALGEHGGHRAARDRAAARLAADIAEALAGRPVPAWPDDPALVASTLALSVLAGIDVRGALVAQARVPEVARTPWYAAQVCAALGNDAPDDLWKVCVQGLDADAWAPWTAIAARARGDEAIVARCETALVAAVRAYGAVYGPGGPETARTAATVEALAPFTSEPTRAAAKRAAGFLGRTQLAELGEPDHPDTIDGAFPATPDTDLLRTDVTAHALLALLAWSRRAER